MLEGRELAFGDCSSPDLLQNSENVERFRLAIRDLYQSDHGHLDIPHECSCPVDRKSVVKRAEQVSQNTVIATQRSLEASISHLGRGRGAVHEACATGSSATRAHRLFLESTM